ncbi:pirin-like C-terminal cupin domain-containing protein [Nonomuraea fuscirosea]|uniref:pirin-like C-terminal cupin domain-containing protein n=1 Tax=Nonomuraea fuscirosea TaxID=1291556 RepID=UPI00340C3A68
MGEAVYASGPFVMNTRAEIEQAYRDFHSGKFGSIPRALRHVIHERGAVSGIRQPG